MLKSESIVNFSYCGIANDNLIHSIRNSTSTSVSQTLDILTNEYNLSSIEQLNFSGNYLQSIGLIQVLTWLLTHTLVNLKFLDLSNIKIDENDLNDDRLSVLCRLLLKLTKQHCHLVIDLQDNQLSSILHLKSSQIIIDLLGLQDLSDDPTPFGHDWTESETTTWRRLFSQAFLKYNDDWNQIIGSNLSRTELDIEFYPKYTSFQEYYIWTNLHVYATIDNSNRDIIRAPRHPPNIDLK